MQGSKPEQWAEEGEHGRGGKEQRKGRRRGGTAKEEVKRTSILGRGLVGRKKRLNVTRGGTGSNLFLHTFTCINS